MSEIRSCVRCGSPEGVRLVSGKFNCSGVTVYKDGFALTDAKQLNTSDEMVHCPACNATYPLGDIYPETET